MRQNHENLNRGRDFQELAATALGKHWGVAFDLEVPFLIGDPPKAQKFDLATRDRTCVGEAKNITWTQTGNMPSAKMAFVNQAVFYLWHLPSNLRRFVVMSRDVRTRTGEALADYYFRTYRHLLGSIHIVEVETSTAVVRILG